MQQDILLKLRDGDRSTIRDIYKDAFGYCASIILKNGGTMNDARDLFQDALMVLLRQSQKIEFTLTCSPKTYLYSVMRNLWLKHLDKQKRGGLLLSLDQEEGKEIIDIPSDATDDKIEHERKFQVIVEAIKMINEECRKLLIDYYYKRLDLGVIAKRMEYTYAFIKVKKNRCMKRLKDKVSTLFVD